jgi:hypothetical protein
MVLLCIVVELDQAYNSDALICATPDGGPSKLGFGVVLRIKYCNILSQVIAVSKPKGGFPY